jgi:hypothetical protein
METFTAEIVQTERQALSFNVSPDSLIDVSATVNVNRISSLVSGKPVCATSKLVNVETINNLFPNRRLLLRQHDHAVVAGADRRDNTAGSVLQLRAARHISTLEPDVARPLSKTTIDVQQPTSDAGSSLLLQRPVAKSTKASSWETLFMLIPPIIFLWIAQVKAYMLCKLWDPLEGFMMMLHRMYCFYRLQLNLSHAPTCFPAMWTQFAVNSVENTSFLLSKALLEDRSGFSQAFAPGALKALCNLQQALVGYSIALQQAHIAFAHLRQKGVVSEWSTGSSLNIGILAGIEGEASLIDSSGTAQKPTVGFTAAASTHFRRSKRYAPLSAELQQLAAVVDNAILTIRSSYADILPASSGTSSTYGY